jgi:hypothetical protein
MEPNLPKDEIHFEDFEHKHEFIPKLKNIYCSGVHIKDDGTIYRPACSCEQCISRFFSDYDLDRNLYLL